MILLLLFSFLAGIVTVLSPCILPLLPIILSSSDASGKQKPLGVVIGFVASFTFFTLFLSTLVRLSGVSADSLRFLSVVILALFGASLLVPLVQITIERLFQKLTKFFPVDQSRSGFFGGLLIGFSLGLLWTPCVGPILASVISLAITGSVTVQAFLITLAYSVGTALPMLAIMLAGSTALQKVPWLVRNSGKIQKAFGVLMIVTGVGIFFQVDRRFQTFILETFPQYGAGLTQLEDQEAVLEELDALQPQTQQKQQLNLNTAPELVEGGEWFNSPPLKLEELRGKVVLVDFWTYSCINCQRTFPYLKKWWETYQETGLVIIGVHSPEFEFEKNPKNVQKAIADFAIPYPVMQDNNFATWNAYANRYWPAKYLIDGQGKVRYTHFGEGRYDETEKEIQKLLAELGAEVMPREISNPDYQIYSRTPELYLGYSRLQHLSSPEEFLPDEKTNFSSPLLVPPNTFAFSGIWTVTPEYAAPEKGAKLRLNFESRDVFLVARPKRGESSTFQVQLDGKKQESVTVTSDSLYQVIQLPEPGRHLLELEFLDDSLELYAFTFG